MWLINADGRCTGFTLPDERDMRQDVLAYRSYLLARDLYPAAETFSTRRIRLNTADRNATRFSQQLANTLIPPALRLELARATRLIIVLDGPVSWVPFA